MDRRIPWALSTIVFVGLAIASSALASLDDLDEATLAVGSEMASALELNDEQVTDLERRVERNPWDSRSRTMLIAHYVVAGLTDPGARATRHEHILWFIEHQPESPVLGLTSLDENSLLGGRASQQGAALWREHLERDPANLAILHNAAAYFRNTDRDLSIELFERASQLEPGNPRWRELIGQTRMLDALLVAVPDVESAAEAVDAFESALEDTGDARRLQLLADAAEAAALAEEWEKALAHSGELLRSAAEDETSWFYGNAVHRGNLVMGHAAFAQGNIDAAELFLIRAGHTPGSPQLNSFGPNMRLARDLLDEGRREAVIEFLKLCGRFWQKEITDAWVQRIESGSMPDFGPNLR